MPQKVVVRVDEVRRDARRACSVDRAPEGRVVDGQVVAAVEDDDVGGVAAEVLGGDRGGPRALAARVLEPAAGHRAEHAGAPHAGEHDERDGERHHPAPAAVHHSAEGLEHGVSSASVAQCVNGVS